MKKPRLRDQLRHGTTHTAILSNCVGESKRNSRS